MKKRIGELLVEAGAVTDNDVREALGHQRAWASNQKLGEVLVSVGKTTPAAVARALSVQFDLPFVKLPEIPEKVSALVPLPYQEEHKVIPFKVDAEGKAERLHIAVGDPANLEVVDELRFQLRKTVRIYVAATDDITQAIAIQKGEALEEIQPIEIDDEEEEEIPVVVERTPATAPPQNWFSGNKGATDDLPEEWSLGPDPGIPEKDKLAKAPLPATSKDVEALFSPNTKPAEITRFPPKTTSKPELPAVAPVAKRPSNPELPAISAAPPKTPSNPELPAISAAPPKTPSNPEMPAVDAAAPSKSEPPPSPPESDIEVEESHPFSAVIEDSWGDLFPGGEKPEPPEKTAAEKPVEKAAEKPAEKPAEKKPEPVPTPSGTAPLSAALAPPSISALPTAALQPDTGSTAQPQAPAPRSMAAPTLPSPTPSAVQSSAPAPSPSATHPPTGSLLNKSAASSTSAPEPASIDAPPRAEPPKDAKQPRLELSDDDLRILDDIERIASGAQPMSESEKVKPAQMVASLIRLLIKKGVIEELEFLDELSRK